jgi:hypothetical protein
LQLSECNTKFVSLPLPLAPTAGDALTAGCFLSRHICRIERGLEVQIVLSGRDAGTMQLRGAPTKVQSAGKSAVQISRWKAVDVATDASAAAFNQFLLDLFKQ